MLTRTRVRRSGFSLVEILIAAVVLAGLGGVLMGLISSNSQVSARAGELQMASLVGARVMDRLLALEYGGLKARLKAKGADEVLDLSTLPPGDSSPGDDGRTDPAALTGPAAVAANALLIDGFTFTARSHLVEPKPGLLAVQLTIAWQRFGTSTPKDPGQLSLTRLLSDPMSAMAGTEVR